MTRHFISYPPADANSSLILRYCFCKALCDILNLKINYRNQIMYAIYVKYSATKNLHTLLDNTKINFSGHPLKRPEAKVPHLRLAPGCSISPAVIVFLNQPTCWNAKMLLENSLLKGNSFILKGIYC